MHYDFQVLMVCTGNICRSPTAEAVLRKLLAERGLHAAIGVDSAGTHALAGSPPDPRSVAAASRRGYELSCLRARQFVRGDFERFNCIVAMDADNLRWLHAQQSAHAGQETQTLQKAQLLMAYGRPPRVAQDVPDPYYGAPEGFEQVLTLIEDACQGLLLSLVEPRQARGHPSQ